MAKRTIDISLKMDLSTDDEDFLEGFDEASNEEIRDCLRDGIEDRLTVQYDNVSVRLRDIKAVKAN